MSGETGESVEDEAERRSPRSPAATAILDAAEELFCAKGFSAVSMREIAAASGQHLSSANYYFGSKTGLFEAAFLRRIVPVNRRRLELLNGSLEAGRQGLTDIVDAYLRPLFEGEPGDEGQRARLIMLFSKQLLSNPDEHEYLQSYYDEVSRHFIRRIQTLLPGMDTAEAVWGYNYMIGVLIFTLAGREPLARIPDELVGAIQPDEDTERTIARLKTFVCAGLEALAGGQAPRDGLEGTA